MQEYATAVRSCYERELRGDPTLEGQLILSLKINQLGDVASVQTEGSFASNALYQCVRNVARRFKLPRPKEGDCAVVTVPYRFRPKL